MGAWLLGAVLFVCFLLGALLAVRAGARFWDRYRENFVDQARLNLSDMFLFMDTTQLFLFNAVLLVVVPLLVWFVTGSLIIALLLAALLAFLPRKVYAWMKQRRIDKIQEQLPDALQMLSGSLRAGVGFAPAMEVLVHDGQPPLAQELALVLREQHLGVRTEEALEHFSDRVPIVDAKLFVSAVNISREVGGNLAETLATLAETLRRRLIMENKVKALTSQGRLQGIVMAMLPVFLIGYLTFMYSSTMQPMFHTWHGWLVIAICVVMEYLGYRMCRKIMTIDV
ncbi:type II secretion system F family protein [Pseudoxanthomonas helianthi]|uniref:Type II secretion system F family protein n=1 Tax=Pseudoxanthomonas helianthi TaxID=1453541 RepID=A0A940X0L2_9GAMM|nr:type II secretion system F family protein [Pseudoxanthomonas helianthi]MBP3983889.1 type II secretion system F family protein [Pseudoxanthomonas helianthi]